MAPFRFTEPLDYEIRYKRMEAAESVSRPTASGERLDAYTVRWSLPSILARY